MSNDSREFQEAVLNLAVGYIDEDFERRADGQYLDNSVRKLYQLWQAAQSRHEAEREALVRKLRDMPFVTIEQKSRFRDEVFALLSDSGSQG
jgi:hypothetical protein